MFIMWCFLSLKWWWFFLFLSGWTSFLGVVLLRTKFTDEDKLNPGRYGRRIKVLGYCEDQSTECVAQAELAFNISEQMKEVSIIRVVSFFYTKLSPSLVCKLFLNHFLSLIHWPGRFESIRSKLLDTCTEQKAYVLWAKFFLVAC